MIIRGILDRSLSSQLCIRGFAPIKELARVSKADYSYQRNPLYYQEGRISKFLDEEEYLFFPEVILSLKLRKDMTSLKPKESTFVPIVELEKSKKFQSNVDKLSLKVKQQKYASQVDVRGNDTLDIVELEIEDSYLLELIEKGEHPFHRIDGNHRLKAAESTNSSKLDRMICPFCIILNDVIIEEGFDEDNNLIKKENNKNKKFDKVVFHNINTKTVPLTSEENLKVIIDDDENFLDSELKDKFGWEFFATRQIFKKLPDNLEDVFPNLGSEFLENPRTFTIELIKLLIDRKVITKHKYNIKNINESLKEVNQILGNDEILKQLDSFEITIACIYILMNGGNLTIFTNWLKKNHIYKLENLNINSLIDIYLSIRESLKKEIFVSMAFRPETKAHYKAIRTAVEEINKEYNLEIKLRDLRIDMFNAGYSYDINKEILKKIEESGLLIVDVSEPNSNVYHELGYLMGLNKAKGFGENFIVIKNDSTDFKDKKVGFNITAINQLRFKDTLTLSKELKERIKVYYDLK